jgi:hypothetical protein
VTARRSIRSRTIAVATATAGALVTSSGFADEEHHRRQPSDIEHVLLLSVDGFHAVDLESCVASGTCPQLAKLTKHGTTYNNASTTKPSDSFPGLLAQLTGGTPKSTGVFYDDSYDRTLFAPGSNCSKGPGTETNYAENLAQNQHRIDGGLQSSLTGHNSAIAISPDHLAGQLVNGVCAPVWPHNLVRTNTIFGVIHRHHLLTAWSDKHPAYDIVNGPTPSQPMGPAPMLMISSRPRSTRI